MCDYEQEKASCSEPSGDDIVHNIPMNIGQSEIAPGVTSSNSVRGGMSILESAPSSGIGVKLLFADVPAFGHLGDSPEGVPSTDAPVAASTFDAGLFHPQGAASRF
jgi:hypothetical protein